MNRRNSITASRRSSLSKTQTITTATTTTTVAATTTTTMATTSTATATKITTRTMSSSQPSSTKIQAHENSPNDFKLNNPYLCLTTNPAHNQKNFDDDKKIIVTMSKKNDH